MSLFKQINSLLFGLFLLVISCFGYFQFSQTTAFMNQQMQAELKNTTYALSLMLKPYLEIGDATAAQRVISVIFETGNYKTIRLTWLSDQDVQLKEYVHRESDVPQWFLNLNLFEEKSSNTVIYGDLEALAKLEIETNSGLIYQQLWQIMNNTLMLLAAVFLIFISVIHYRLKKILMPLQRVAIQAKLIAKREFKSDLAVPQAEELKEVVFAINSMSAQLQNIFVQLDKEVMALKEEKFTDQVSQLPNRLYLNTHIESWLAEPGYGGLLIANLHWLKVIHQQSGYQVRDHCIEVLAQEMQQTLPLIAPCIIARISNSEFAFLISKGASGHLAIYLQRLIRLINQAMESAKPQSDALFSIGGVERRADLTASQLLGNADNALQHARAEKLAYYWYQADEPEMILDHAHLAGAIEKQQFLLRWQPIISFDTGKVLQHEVYCQLNINKQTLQAEQFMPMVEQLQLGCQFDKHLLSAIEAHSKMAQSENIIAINITQNSVLDERFHLWLGEFIERQVNSKALHFELREDCVLAHPKQSAKLVQMIRKKGSQFGIDNCGLEMGSLDYLQKTKPDYVKLDRTLSCQLNNEMEMGELHQRIELTRAVVHAARALGCEIIMTGVDTASQLQVVKSLQATAYQGLLMPIVDI